MLSKLNYSPAMARPLRIEYPGAVYHITSRGNAKQDIFDNDSDREKFLSILEHVVDRFHWLCHCYCLMDNHYHLLIETPGANLSEGMRQLNGIYTQAYNRRHGKVGHLLQGRFKAILVEKQAHLLELSRYIVLNPVRAKIIHSVEEYHWSSYLATLGRANMPDFLTVTWLLENFSPQIAHAQQLYQDFVDKGVKLSDSPWDKLTGQIFLGSDEFILQVKNQSEPRSNSDEVPSTHRYAGRPDLLKIFPQGVDMSKKQRNHLIFQAHVEYGYRLNQIAEVLGIHYTTVSKVIKKENN